MRLSRIAHRALLCLLTTSSLLAQAQSGSGSTGTAGSGNAALMSTGGQFSVSPSGAANYRIPIQVPPGVAGMAPKLELVYSSQGGNGILGLGWGISGLSTISRCARTKAQDGIVGGSVNFDANDRFCLDGQRLVLVSGTYGAAGSEYRTEIESFTKITALGTAGSGPASFLAKTKSGLTIEFGNTTDSRIEAVKAAGVTSAWTTGTVRAWAQNKVSDVKGNYLTVTYSKDSSNGSYLPSSMDYTGNASSTPVLSPGMSVVFVPGAAARLDAVIGYQAGASYLNPKRIAKIQTKVGAALVKEYRLDYAAQATALDRSQLSSITECDATGSCLPATSVQWGTRKTTAFNTASTWIADFGTANSWTDASINPRQVVDVNGDGLADIVGFGPNGVMVSLNTGTGFAAATSWIAQFGTAQGWVNNSVHPRQLADVNGDGLPDIVGFGPSGVMVSLNKGTGFATSTSWSTYYGTNGGWSDTNAYPRYVVDVNGDGLPDIVGFSSTGVMVALNTGSSFATAINWISYYGTSAGGWSESNTYPRYVVDVNGDGLPDIVGFSSIGVMVALNTGTSFATAVNWNAYYGTSAGGWSENNTYPRYVVDVNGDGLPDIVGFSSTGVMVALNTGTSFAPATNWIAQFGTSAGGWTDNNVQPRQLVDVNADGLPDIVGFGPAGVMVALNTGSSFAAATTWITGYGTTAGWTNNSTHPRQLIDVTGDGIPDVMGFFSSGVSVASNQQDTQPSYVTSLNNGLGATTSVNYGPLTLGSYYTKDSAATAASFPQVDIKAPFYVVTSLNSSNGVGSSNVTSYTYGGLKAEVATGRGLLGFRWIKQKNERTGIESYSEFRQDFPYVGMVSKSEQRLSAAGNAGVLKRTTSTLACKAPDTGSACAVQARCDLSTNIAACVSATNARYFRYVSNTLDESWDINGTAYPSTQYVTEYGLDSVDGKLYGDASRVQLSTSDGASSTSVNEYFPVSSSTGAQGLLKKSVVTNITPTFAGSGTPSDPYLPPTITASQSPANWVATLPGTLSWTSTNASSVRYSCTSTGSGFTASGTVWPNGTTASQIASEAWAGIPSTCVFTAAGPGGTATYSLTVNTLPPPRVPVIVNVGTQANYLANTAKATGYIAGRTDITFNITGTVGSASTGQYAFTVDSSWAPGDTVKIVVNPGAAIYGAGGGGGTRARAPADDSGYPAVAGQGGGPALLIQRVTTIVNNGSIGGGGGGGGGGGTGARQSVSSGAAWMYVDGGDGGRGQGAGAAGSYSATAGAAGYSTTLYGSPWAGGSGGNGGSLGNAGGGGGGGVGYGAPPAGGGAAGAAVVGNSFVTWTTAGTRLGALQ
ncbi:FG-GAP-like repeat-containing protein [Rhodoferax mekongensis]|uniref:FG-GAP-like repeat-containing protein n=1 Tax=Rhodoferax mekongensis TaxID=3068341 RepID=UPI0028BE1F95|nr:FG-GAP-like repeat-containing protein [Rhodoferax sp. TBRC 17199]MDT7516991.1 FG-GAP-like repeat-containing protein [Rhodoferax sp. TBRC 17199]MDT7517133.1 FG-GAP-like repeat-containing protein [Rhodoferax sp. TBRC 17199]